MGPRRPLKAYSQIPGAPIAERRVELGRAGLQIQIDDPHLVLGRSPTGRQHDPVAVRLDRDPVGPLGFSPNQFGGDAIWQQTHLCGTPVFVARRSSREHHRLTPTGTLATISP